MTAAETIRRILSVQYANADDEFGDKHLSDPVLALEAIDAALIGDDDNPVLRMFLAAAPDA